jgi:hypothetical protein
VTHWCIGISKVHELELQGIASRVARSREAISRQLSVSVWDRKSGWKTGGRNRGSRELGSS